MQEQVKANILVHKNFHLLFQINDKTVIPKARLTIPDEVEVQRLVDDTYSVKAKCLILKGTQFGPLQAKKLCTLLPTIPFPLKIFSSDDEDLSECFMDTSNESECNWMMFIPAANNFEEQNLICFQVSYDRNLSVLFGSWGQI